MVRAPTRRAPSPALLAALVACSWLLLFGCSQPVTVELPPAKVGVVPVLSAEIAEEARFPGRTVAPQRVELRTQVEGSIRERFFTDGQRVSRGDRLVQIDARSPEAALAQAKADLARAQVNAAEAAKIAATNTTLFEQNVIGREELRESKTAADAARTLVRAQQAIVASAELTRGFATIVAPFDGRISEAKVDVGGLVTPGGEVIAVLARLDPMYFDFALSEREFLGLPGSAQRRARARAGQPPAEGGRLDDDMTAVDEALLVALELVDGSIHPYQGVLSRVSVELDAATGTYPMRAVFPNPEELLIPNLFGRVILRTRAKREAVLIPQEALVLEQVGTIVYVVGEAGELEQRRVTLGQRVGELVEIREGLARDETVVSRGVHKCRDGLRVEAESLAPLTLASDPLATEPASGPEGWYARFLAERRVATLVGE